MCPRHTVSSAGFVLPGWICSVLSPRHSPWSWLLQSALGVETHKASQGFPLAWSVFSGLIFSCLFTYLSFIYLFTSFNLFFIYLFSNLTRIYSDQYSLDLIKSLQTCFMSSFPISDYFRIKFLRLSEQCSTDGQGSKPSQMVTQLFRSCRSFHSQAVNKKHHG